MAEQTITRTHKNKNKEVVSITYRVDPEFVPKDISEICDQFIVNYCEAYGKEDWLVEQLSKTETAKAKKDRTVKAIVNGEEKEIQVKAGETYQQKCSFVSTRSAFANEFFSSIVKGTPVKESPFEIFLKKHKK